MFDENETTCRERLEKALNALAGGCSYIDSVAGEKTSPAATKGQKVLRRAAQGGGDSEKGYMIDSRHRQCDVDVRAAICEACMVRAAKQSEAKHDAVGAPKVLEMVERSPSPMYLRKDQSPRTRVALIVIPARQ